jgi:phage terminase large subunit
MELFNKQLEAVYWLRQPEINEVLYGGAAGGGKSALGCLWLIEMCQTYEGSRWLMGRSKLKTLKETTLNTFFQLSSKLGISDQYEYKAQAGTIDWHNGSQIILKDLFLYPADPEFDGLGSLEITGAFIDEVSQITYKAWQIVKSRIRYQLNEFGLTPKLFASCNPAKNWTYRQFYQPSRDGNLKPYRAFVRALPTDNPHLPPSYLQSLLELDENSKQRLYFGNWDYDDDPSRLCDYTAILSTFKNDHSPKGNKYITADVARFGSDRAIICVWDGWNIIDYKAFEKSKTTDIQDQIKAFRDRYAIPVFNCIADEDGVGGGVVDSSGILGFTNNGKPLPTQTGKENYYNLQTQCGYGLAKVINEGLLNFSIKMPEHEKEMIIEELGQLKTWKQDQDGKLYLLPKKEVKDSIGRSPDWRDVLLMRYYFDIQKGQNKAQSFRLPTKRDPYKQSLKGWI